MKKPDETKNTLPCCQVDEVTCRECRYFGQAFCANIALKDAMTKIEQLNETISLMKIQMQGDCGCCKHRNDDRVIEDGQMGCRLSPACYECLSRGGRSQWEYEGLPEVERHDKPV